MFSCAFHTGYVVDNVLNLPRGEVDVHKPPKRKRKGRAHAHAHARAKFGEGFSVDLIFSSVEDSEVRLVCANSVVCAGVGAAVVVAVAVGVNLWCCVEIHGRQ